MTYWLDAHFDPDLATWIGAIHKLIVLSIRELGLAEAEDEMIFFAARRFGPTSIVTKDRDLAELVKRHGAPPRIVWVRLANLTKVPLRTYMVTPFAEVARLIELGSPLVTLDQNGARAE